MCFPSRSAACSPELNCMHLLVRPKAMGTRILFLWPILIPEQLQNRFDFGNLRYSE